MVDANPAPSARTWKWHGFGVRVEVPGGLADRLRKLRGGGSRGDAQTDDGLLLAGDLPDLHVEKRDVEGVLAFFRDPAQDLPTDQQQPVFSSARHAELAASGHPMADQLARFPWYHTIELPGGLATPGFFDHRPLVPHYGLPARWPASAPSTSPPSTGSGPFELEDRGAAEVMAIDLDRASQTDMPPAARRLILDRGIDLPFGRGFALAKGPVTPTSSGSWQHLRPRPGRIGTFDFVHMADVLLHLERPLEALRHLRSITAPDGEALIADSIAPDVEGQVTEYLGGWKGVVWWRPSLDTLAQMIIDAGFGSVELRQNLQPRRAPLPDG